VAAEPGKAEEIAAVIREIQERVRSRYPQGADDPPIAFADLLPVVHARDAAEGKVAAIGRVNPRPGGLANNTIQRVKRLIARALDWHVRDQIDFNRAVVQCVQATLDALNENNRALASTLSWVKEQRQILTGQVETSRQIMTSQVETWRQIMEGKAEQLEGETRELRDIRQHWYTWREALEERTNRSEIYMLRTISELQASFQHRLTQTVELMDDKVKTQHADYLGALDRATLDIQQRLWKDLDYIRIEYEKLIYNELKTVRQRLMAVASNGPHELATRHSSLANSIDWLRFAERFRGAEERVRAMQSLYTEKFAGARNVLDIGCGRGEFLEAAREAAIGARGIDLNEESVALCRSKGLEAEVADLFAYLPALADSSLGGVYCAQVIEHIAPERLPDMIRLLSAKVAAGGLVAFETPNPECLAIFASHFYIDPTHTRPVPSSLLAFYLEEAGFGHIEVRQLEPAVESWPELSELAQAFRERFFGGLDYALFARKL
jgi:O-antigen chain-terminating methyltransferase